LPPDILMGVAARRNAQKRAAQADVKASLAELRAPIAEMLEISLAVLIERADQIYSQTMLLGRGHVHQCLQSPRCGTRKKAAGLMGGKSSEPAFSCGAFCSTILHYVALLRLHRL
jgi:hypothetical protein